jgi:large subunit GTPase 1
MLFQQLKGHLKAVEKPSDGRKPTVGFVGFPNVGKSSVINALFGSKKTSMSRQPGKTKHFQTLEMPEQGLTLCDCPGLVFPSAVATKAHLVINGTIPLDQLNSFADPIELIVRKMGAEKVAKHYGCEAELAAAIKELRNAADPEEAARVILQALARARGHLLRARVPDETWSARRILKDLVTGALLYCEEPPTPVKAPPAKAPPIFQPPPRQEQTEGTSSTAKPGEVTNKEVTEKAASIPIPDSDDELKEEADLDGSDLEDLSAFLRETGSLGGQQNVTKRAQRMNRKRTEKGGHHLGRKEMISVQ